MAKTYFGVDISEHNGTVDWAKVAKKVDFAILRVGWVGNNNNHTIDKKFNENYAAAKKAGVKLGAYVYMYSKSTSAAIKGAEWAVQQIKGKFFDLPVYCDMEDASISGLSKATLTAITDTFNKVIQKAGYKAGVYANKYWFDSKLDKSLRTAYHTWIAHYTSGNNKYKGEYEMWQNSSKGKVDGVKGNVDTNYLYENIFVSAASSTSQNKPTTSAVKSNTPTYKIGSTYTLQVDLKVRKGAGTGYAQKLRSELTADGRKNAQAGRYAVLKKGTKVTAKRVQKVGNDIWLQIPSGWVAGYYNKNIYVK